MSKESRGHGGLIRREKRVNTDKHGNTTTQHWDGRQDVTVRPSAVKYGATVQGDKK